MQKIIVRLIKKSNVAGWTVWDRARDPVFTQGYVLYSSEMEKNIEFCTGTHQGFGQLTLELVNLWVGLGGGGGLGWGVKRILSQGKVQ